MKYYLFVYFIVDSSSEMYGEKIGTLNNAIQSLIADLIDMSEDYNIETYIGTRKDNDASVLSDKLCKIDDYVFVDMDASGISTASAMLNLLSKEIDRIKVCKKNIIVMPILISGSKVSDNYYDSLIKLQKMPLFKRGIKVGVSIGPKSDDVLLRQFTGNVDLVFEANQTRSIAEVLRHIGHNEDGIWDDNDWAEGVTINDIYEISDSSNIGDTNPKLNDLINDDYYVLTLKNLISKYGEIWENYKVAKAILMDSFPENKVLWRTLLVCVEESITKEISLLEKCTQIEFHRFVNKIKATIGCTDEIAHRAVSLWINAIGVEIISESNEDSVLDHKIDYIEDRQYDVIPFKKILSKDVSELNIDEIELSVRTLNCLKRAGINTVGDLTSKKPEGMMGVRNLGRKSLEEVLEKLNELGLELSPGEDKYTEKNHPGREKCDKLREIRRKIADANGIDFELAECHHTGPCLGTCPVCDEEIKYLDEQLQKKKARGEVIVLNGLAADDIKASGCDVESNESDYFDGDNW